MKVLLETLPGPDFSDGRFHVTPVARSMTVLVGIKNQGGSPGGGPDDDRDRAAVVLVRRWPSAVLVSTERQTVRLPVVDSTRWAQVAILLVALVWIFAMWRRTRTRKERS